MPALELEHRLGRYGLNPCVTPDTWVLTENGARQVKNLISRQHGTFVNGEIFSTTVEGFFFSGVKPVVKLESKEGFFLRLTMNHKVLKVTAQTQKKQYFEWVEVGDLKPEDKILLHNHRDLAAWDGNGTFEVGWLLGNLLEDNHLAKTLREDTAIPQLRGATKAEILENTIKVVSVKCGKKLAAHNSRFRNISGESYSWLAALALAFDLVPGSKKITSKIEESSYDFYRGFLRGIFDADGSVQGEPLKGVRVRLTPKAILKP